ncbi:MAG: hypothetical protein G01um101420_368 [Parcubacteria group bacterium Gr01-1014_20]|nr:MAG: hypothetical protein G01um101420_368 [Parcubacteria group bacterium Gr01-1014_20]
MGAITKVFNSIFADLSPRGREVIVGRFGLSGPNSEPQTLAALGNKYGITRERVRQIEAAGLNLLKQKIATNKDCQAILSKGKKSLESVGGVISEDILLKQLNSGDDSITKNQLALLLESSKNFHFHDEDQNYRSFYFQDRKNLDNLNKFVAQLVKFLKPQKEAVLAGNYENFFVKFIKAEKINENSARNFVAISKKVFSNPYSDTGLAEWPEIKPQNIRDRIYLVLKKSAEPLHFEQITSLINEVKFDKKVALAPTVHNELIKDNRFVLVGRGIYGLTEKGFKPGTVQEVIKRILKQNGPMNTKQISLAVQKERILKQNTILVNLQNRKFFERLGDGTYQIREA